MKASRNIRTGDTGHHPSSPPHQDPLPSHPLGGVVAGTLGAVGPRLVLLASPFADDTDRNIAYAVRACRDAIARGEAPLAPHLLYPRFLDDEVPDERELGMDCGKAWLGVADALVVYADLGVSAGMREEIGRAIRLCKTVEFRSIGAAP